MYSTTLYLSSPELPVLLVLQVGSTVDAMCGVVEDLLMVKLGSTHLGGA